MSLFEELKRRNVFRVGVAYAVGAWLLLQLTEVLSELLKLPDEIGPIVVAAVAIGFPVVLFFAWAYEMTPQGIKREKDVDRDASITRQTGRKLDRTIIAMLVVVAGYFIWESRFAERTEEQPAEPINLNVEQSPAPVPTLETEPETSRQSIAVLPFTNRSRNEDDAFFVDGIHDDLLTNLARISGLKVISRTSVLRFKDTEKPIPEIASELGVATVMEGAVQRSGTAVRINVQLIDAATDEHLWAEIFDRELTADNLFAIQSEISESIAEALEATLSPEEQQRISNRPTDNLAAYDAYLRGRQLMARRTSQDLTRALEEFQLAVEKDPRFALAWVGVAETASLLPGYSAINPTDMIPVSTEATRNALEINDQLGEAHLSQARLLARLERYEEAESAFQRAIELSPNYASAYQWYADFVNAWPARSEEALELTKKAAQLDPLSAIIQLEIAEKLNFLGRFEAATGQLERLLANDPDFAPAYSMMAGVQENLGRFDEAIRWARRGMEIDPGRLSAFVQLAPFYLNLGDIEGVQQIRESLSQQDPDHFGNEFLAIMQSLYEENYRGAMETMPALVEKIGQQQGFQITFAFISLLAGDLEGARAALERGEPRFFDRATWDEALQFQAGTGCDVAWVMAQTGDTSMGQELLAYTIDFMENELTGYMDHADRFNYPACYAIVGDYEKAMDAIEVQVEHRHTAFWWLWTRMPYFEPLRGTPRFEAAMTEIREQMAEQRGSLEPSEGLRL